MQYYQLFGLKNLNIDNIFIGNGVSELIVMSLQALVNEGDEIKFGNTTLNIKQVPGHSPGSIALYNEKEKFVIVGDVLFKGGIGRTDLPGGDYDTLIESINNKLFTLNNDVIVYPGHGESTSIGYEKSNNPFF